MPVHPYFVRRFALLEGISGYEDGLTNPDIAERLRAWEAQGDEWAVPDGVSVRDASVPGPHGDIPVRIYDGQVVDSTRPGVLWMHGGGYVGGDLDMAEGHTVSAELAARTGATVVSVDYRLAVGGVTYPVPLDDVIAAWKWLVASRDTLGVTGGLFVGGGSAGAGLASGAALRLHDEGETEPDGVLLAYPGLHFPLPPLSSVVAEEMRGLPELVRLEYETALALQRNYVGRIHNVPRYAAPGNSSLSGLPPTSIIVSEYDDLRTSGELFAQQLAEAGVAVRLHLADGMLHGHLNRVPGPLLPEVEKSLDFFVEAIRHPVAVV